MINPGAARTEKEGTYRNMKLLFAPLEGITTYTYRNVHRKIFSGCDAYYAPFITPSDNEKITRKGLRDVVPEHNPETNLKVQVLTNRSDSFLKFSRKIRSIGYDEININLGCPFERVVRKGRGAGCLRDPEELDRFLDGIFPTDGMKVSIKTRIGYASGDEMGKLLQIYNQYPLSLLIVHPRAREDFYKGSPDMQVFSEVYRDSKNPLCYNGDIKTVHDFSKIEHDFPDLRSVMLGRGAVKNPALFREIQGGEKLRTEELLAFSDLLAEEYLRVLASETFTLQKLKEVWAYMMQNFPEETKIAKAIKKAGTTEELHHAATMLPELS